MEMGLEVNPANGGTPAPNHRDGDDGDYSVGLLPHTPFAKTAPNYEKVTGQELRMEGSNAVDSSFTWKSEEGFPSLPMAAIVNRWMAAMEMWPVLPTALTGFFLYRKRSSSNSRPHS